MLAMVRIFDLEPSFAGLIALVIGMAVAAWFLTKVIVHAANQRPAAMIVTALSVLTLVALGGYILTEQETLGTIAATGVGALAGSVTALFSKQDPPEGTLDDNDFKEMP